VLQRFGQEHGVLLDAVVPEGLGLVVEADGDADAQAGKCWGSLIDKQLSIR
jgi:hypothetical protein